MRKRRFLLLFCWLISISIVFPQRTFCQDSTKSAVFKCIINGVPESSGLVFTGNQLWTHGDSGNSSSIFAIDTVTGNIIQTVRIDNYPNTDWEDIAADNDFIYIGDFGNNLGNRTDLKILKIAKDSIGNQETVHVKAEAIRFSYLDQQSFAADNKTDYDCEALISFHDSLYIFTKDHRDYHTRVYGLPKNPGNYQVNPIADFNIGGVVTGADCDSLSNKIILIGYDGSKRHSFLYLLSEFHGNQFFSGNVEKVMSADNTQWQTEGVCFVNSHQLFLSCETTADVPASLYDFYLPDSLSTYSAPSKSMGIKYFPNPASGFLNIDSDEKIKSLSITDIQGKTILNLELNSHQYRVNLEALNLKNGIYFLELNTDDAVEVKKIVIRN